MDPKLSKKQQDRMANLTAAAMYAPLGEKGDEYIAKLTEEAKQIRADPRGRTSPGRFSTDACIEWGRAQGWKLLDRERYDARTKRHHDVLLGADAMFESDMGMVLVQGAGKGERTGHYARFEERGGVERCKKLSLRFVYVEFVRGQEAPIKEEWWSEAQEVSE